MKPFLKPAFGKLNSPYGYRVHPIYKTKKKHEGIDISRNTGNENIFAAYDGVISRVKHSNVGYGNYITIRHNIDGKTYSTLYAHLSKVYVKEGQEVQVGEVIGLKGTTGASTGVHLHFEVHEGEIDYSFKRNFNPLSMIDMEEDPTKENIVKRRIGDTMSKEIENMLNPNSPKTEPSSSLKEGYDWASENGLISRENANSVVTAAQLSAIMKRLYDKIMKDLG